MYKTEELLDLNHTLAKDYLKQFEYPYLALSGISELILDLAKNLSNEYKQIKENVWVHETATIFESAYINGPCIIGPHTEVRQCAFIRGSALIGEGCVIGNSTEVKNAIIFDGAQIPHFNYAGDSILGYMSHMGGGAVTSNFRSDKKNIVIHAEENIETGLRKMGAILGDYVEVGCNAVLNPGTIIGRNSIIYPTSCVRGVVKENSIYKKDDTIIERK